MEERLRDSTRKGVNAGRTPQGNEGGRLCMCMRRASIFKNVGIEVTLREYKTDQQSSQTMDEQIRNMTWKEEKTSNQEVKGKREFPKIIRNRNGAREEGESLSLSILVHKPCATTLLCARVCVCMMVCFWTSRRMTSMIVTVIER